MEKHLQIHPEYLILGNNPELAKLFSREDAQQLLKRILSDIENNSFKKFMKDGHEKFFDDIIQEFKKSFKILDSKREDRNTTLIKKVKRSFDGKIFKIGDELLLEGSPVKIGRMYMKDMDDDLKIRLDLINKKGTITWRSINDL